MKLTQFTDYALRTLMYLATQPEKRFTVKDISESFNISYHHMVKVAHALSKQGYVKTTKGKGGGISLSKPANEINLGGVVSALEPDFDIAECFSDNNQCHITSICDLKHILFDARNAFIRELEKHSLANIVQNKQALWDLLQPRDN